MNLSHLEELIKWLVSDLKEKAESNFYGSLTLHFENGVVKTIRNEETIKVYGGKINGI